MKIISRADELLGLAHAIAYRASYPEPAVVGELTEKAIAALSSEAPEIRPVSSSGDPGGLIRLSTGLVAVLPDLHARPDLLYDLLGSFFPPQPKARLLDLALDGQLTILCLGDILNAEGRLGADRWTRAARRLARSPGMQGIQSEEMDEEMGASLAALGLVMALKAKLLGCFHCLKGNHDNIGNSNADGDSAFFKFALEGAMGAEWFTIRYGKDLMALLRRYERLLPLVAAGKRFAASHAEPAFPMSVADLLEYRTRPDIVRALIWTANDQAEIGSVMECLSAILGPSIARESGFWVSGHRPIRGSHALRSGGRLVQIDNPDRRLVALIDEGSGGRAGELSLYEIGKAGKELELLDTVVPVHLDQSVPRH